MHRFYVASCSWLIAILICTSMAFGGTPKESNAGIWFIDHENPEAGSMIRLGDFPPVSPEVQTDLDAFNQSLAEAPVHLRDSWLDTSPDGRAFAMGKTSPSAEPHGVWLWPNWRDAAPITFEQFSYFFFVSNRHVELHFTKLADSEVVHTRAVVDFHEPEVLYELPGVGSRSLVLTESGRWAGIASGTGSKGLLVGQLDPEQPNAGAEHAQQVELPVQARIEHLAWLHNGDFLVASVRGADGGQRTLFVVRISDLTVVDSMENAWMFHAGSTAGDTGFYGGMDGQRAFFTVSPEGELSGQPAGFPKEEEGNERPASLSPSGRFIVTYWDDVEFVVGDDGLMKASTLLQTEIRHTPLADPENAIPSWPTYEVDGEEVDAGLYFWFAWD